MTPQLITSRHGATLVLTICNPGMRNALGPEIYAAGTQALTLATQTSDIRSVVLTGEGDHFCAGGNLQRLKANRAQDPSVQGASIDGLHAWVQALRACPKPVIAAVNGAAAGAGFSIALACDFLVASEDAVFVMSYSNIALSPDGGASWHLGQKLPRALASELLMCASRITPARLHALGIVNQVSTSGGALPQALALAEQLNQRAPAAMGSIKALLNHASQEQVMAHHLQMERDHFVDNLHHPHGGEGIQAFLDKRPACYN
jgi:enoyl-CoA hydratase/carnithine racemase